MHMYTLHMRTQMHYKCYFDTLFYVRSVVCLAMPLVIRRSHLSRMSFPRIPIFVMERER